MNIEQMKAVYNDGFGESHEAGLQKLAAAVAAEHVERTGTATEDSIVTELRDKLVNLQNNYDNQSALLRAMRLTAKTAQESAAEAEKVELSSTDVGDVNTLLHGQPEHPDA